MSLATRASQRTSQAPSKRRGTEPTRSSDVYETNGDGDTTLARRLPGRGERFAKLASSLTWSRTSTEISNEGPNSARSVLDVNFHSGILTGITKTPPEKCLSVLKGRRKGTMCAACESKGLPRNAEDVRRRQEHVDKRLVRTPMLFSSPPEGNTELTGMALIREAFLTELRDFYTILSSVDARKYDICRSDIRAMFEWFTTFETFLRLYFIVSETTIYQTAGIDEHGAVSEALSSARRKQEKRRIIKRCDKIEEIRRVLISEADKWEQRSMQILNERVDKLTVRLLRFLDEEVKEVSRDLDDRLSNTEKEVIFRGFMDMMLSCQHGRDMVVMLAKGLGKDASEMGAWLVKNCSKVNRGAVQKWMAQFVERHTNYVKLFEKAESEYRALYKGLGRSIDEELEGLRKEFDRSVSVAQRNSDSDGRRCS